MEELKNFTLRDLFDKLRLSYEQFEEWLKELWKKENPHFAGNVWTLQSESLRVDRVAHANDREHMAKVQVRT